MNRVDANQENQFSTLKQKVVERIYFREIYFLVLLNKFTSCFTESFLHNFHYGYSVENLKTREECRETSLKF